MEMMCRLLIAGGEAGATRVRPEISDQARFHKHSRRFSPCSAGRPELRRAAAAIYTLPRSCEITAAPSSRLSASGFGVGKGFQWTTRPGRPASTPCLIGRPRAPAGPAVAISASAPGCARRRGQGGLDLSGPTYAALDLGTNNCRLLVARATRDSFRVVDAFSRIIRLGEGVTSSGRAERGRDRCARSTRCASAAPRCATAASPARG